ncbi:MAG: hypothetical protein WKF47_12410 [Geodermatophilaceae bacterium]
MEEAGGYTAVLIFNREGSDACTATLGMSVEGDIPTFGVIPRDQGYALFDEPYDDEACLAGDGTADRPDRDRHGRGRGVVHLVLRRLGLCAPVRQQPGGTGTELDTYAIPEAHDPRIRLRVRAI